VGDYIYALIILHPEYNTGTHLIGGLVGTRTGLIVMKMRKPVPLPKALCVINMQVAPGLCFKPCFFPEREGINQKWCLFKKYWNRQGLGGITPKQPVHVQCIYMYLLY